MHTFIASDDDLINELADLIAKNKAPWQKPWKKGESYLPRNMFSGRPYNGLNALRLLKAFPDEPLFLTFNQARKAGLQLKKGEKGTKILYCGPADDESIDDKDEQSKDEKEKRIIKPHTVFNLSQFKNYVRTNRFHEIENLKFNPIDKAQEILDSVDVPIEHKPQNRAYYSQSLDKVVLPLPKQFKSPEAYYRTAFHEVAHSTGHENRLNRDLSGDFGSESYAKEELVAEISSFLIGGHALLGHTPNEETIAYLDEWSKAIKNDPDYLKNAIYEADKVKHYVISNYLDTLNQQRQNEAESLINTHEDKRKMDYNNFVDKCVSTIDISLDSAINSRAISAKEINQNSPYNIFNGNAFSGHSFFTLSFHGDSDLRYITLGQIAKYNENKDENSKLKIKKGAKAIDLAFYKTGEGLLEKNIELPVIVAYKAFNISDLENAPAKEESESLRKPLYYHGKEIKEIRANLGLSPNANIIDIVNKSSELVNNTPESDAISTLRQNITAFELCAKYGIDYQPVRPLNEADKAEIRQYFQEPNNRVSFFQDVHRVFELVTNLNNYQDIIKDANSPKDLNLELADNQERLYFNVPYIEHHAAIKLGATYDNEQEQFYITKDQNLNLFTRWIDKPISLNNIEQINNILNVKGEDRVYLNVPKNERQNVKVHGAKFDYERLAWYITDLSKLNLVKQYYNENFVPDVKEKFYLNVPKDESYIVKAQGAAFDYATQKWFVTDESKLKNLTKYLDNSNNNLSQDVQQKQNEQKYYLNVPKQDYSKVKQAGAIWDFQRQSFYITDANKLDSLSAYYNKDYNPEINNNTAPNKPINRPQPQQNRIYLNVPKQEKDEAKALGAWYDPELFAWYVPPYKKADTFAKWYDPSFDPKAERKVAVIDTNAAIEAFKERLIALDADPAYVSNIKTDTPAYQRIHGINDSRGSTNIAYRLFTDGVPRGSIINYKTGVTEKFVYSAACKYEQVSAAELERRAQELKAKQEQNEIARANAFEQSAKYANEDYSLAKSLDFSDTSTYLNKKGINEHVLNTLKQMDPNLDIRYQSYIDPKNNEFKNLVIPLKDIEGNIKSNQTIRTDGNKKIGYNTYVNNREFCSSRKSGCFYHIGNLENAKRIFVAEGVATAMTVAAATKTPTIAAVDCNNLVNVIDALKKSGKFNNTEIIITADNDLKSIKENPIEGKNAGVEAALKCISKYPDVKFVYPTLSSDEMSQNLSDFNDIYVSRKNLDSVNNMINTQITNQINNKDLFYVKQGSNPNEILLVDRAGIKYPANINNPADKELINQAIQNKSPLVIQGNKNISVNSNGAIQKSVSLNSISNPQARTTQNTQNTGVQYAK